MTRKVDGTQRSGRFTAPSAAGGFGGADTALTRLARPFTPKPFRSTGGMSTSADTMMSLAMGRHNTDDEMPEDQVNISSIVSRKTSDRRYLPRKLGNMKKYLHTTPISEALELPPEEIEKRFQLFEFSLADASQSVRDFFSPSKNPESPPPEDKDDTSAFDSVMGALSAFVPYAGDIYKGYLAYTSIPSIMRDVSDLQKILQESESEFNLFAAPEETLEKMESGEIDIDIRTAADREIIKSRTNRIAALCSNFIANAFSAIPLEPLGLGTLDSIIDSFISAVLGAGGALDPTGEKTANNFFNLAVKFGGELRSAENVLSKFIPGNDFAELHKISNLIGNLSLIHSKIEDLESQSASDEDLPLAERRIRKKKRTNEFSTTAGVAGYTGPMKGPTNPKQFYSTMARAAGSEYLVDPVKTSKPKP